MSTKREIDKENMFRKIMPSAGQSVSARVSASPQAAESPLRQPPAAEPTPPTKEPIFTQLPHQEEPAYAQPAPMQTPAPAQQPTPVSAPPPVYEPPVQQQAAPSPSSQPDIAPPSTLPTEMLAEDIAQTGERPKPINLPELLAERYYTRYQRRLNCCTCQHCRDDVFAIALNKVHPRYVASDRLDMRALDNREMITETVTALIRALLMVKRNPHHSEQDLLRQ